MRKASGSLASVVTVTVFVESSFFFEVLWVELLGPMRVIMRVGTSFWLEELRVVFVTGLDSGFTEWSESILLGASQVLRLENLKLLATFHLLDIIDVRVAYDCHSSQSKE